MEVDIRVGLKLFSKLVSYDAVEEDCTSGLIIEVFDDQDKVGADVILLRCYPQTCMPNPVKSLLEVIKTW